jgi:thiamine pyrophosphokinase
LHWPASPFTSWWQGTLNESLADRFTLDGDGAYLVFRTFDAKP